MKQTLIAAGEKYQQGWSRSSIKTRIETCWRYRVEFEENIVEVEVPLKQGLKQ